MFLSNICYKVFELHNVLLKTKTTAVIHKTKNQYYNHLRRLYVFETKALLN